MTNQPTTEAALIAEARARAEWLLGAFGNAPETERDVDLITRLTDALSLHAEKRLPPPDGGGPEPQCGYCAARFWTTANLRDHMWRAHGVPNPEKPEPAHEGKAGFDTSEPINAALDNLAAGSPERKLALDAWIAAANYYELGHFPHAVAAPIDKPRVDEGDDRGLVHAVLQQRDAYRTRAKDAEAQLRTLTEQRDKAVEGPEKGWRDAECMALIHALRSHEGDEVLILCDNPDFNGQPNNAVECCGGWTNYADKRFTGETLLDALSAAWIERNKSSDPVPYPTRSTLPSIEGDTHE